MEKTFIRHILVAIAVFSIASETASATWTSWLPRVRFGSYSRDKEGTLNVSLSKEAQWGLNACISFGLFGCFWYYRNHKNLQDKYDDLLAKKQASDKSSTSLTTTRDQQDKRIEDLEKENSELTWKLNIEKGVREEHAKTAFQARKRFEELEDQVEIDKRKLTLAQKVVNINNTNNTSRRCITRFLDY